MNEYDIRVRLIAYNSSGGVVETRSVPIADTELEHDRLHELPGVVHVVDLGESNWHRTDA